MDLYKNILSQILSKHTVKVSFENLKTESPHEMVEMVCFKTIQRIRKVLNNTDLDDYECIERIACLLKAIGANGTSRHDF